MPEILPNQKPAPPTNDDASEQKSVNSEDCMSKLKNVKAGEFVGVVSSSVKSGSDVVMFCFTECVKIVKHIVRMATMTASDVTAMGQQRAQELESEPAGANKDFITCFIACVKKLAEAVRNGTVDIFAAFYKE